MRLLTVEEMKNVSGAGANGSAGNGGGGAGGTIGGGESERGGNTSPSEQG